MSNKITLYKISLKTILEAICKLTEPLVCLPIKQNLL